MLDAGRRPMGRFFYWVLAMVVAFAFRLSLFAGPALPTSGSRTLKKPAPGIRGGAAPSSRADSVAAS